MKGTKKEGASNEDINPQVDALTDLPVADEQAEQTRAGAIDQQGRILLGTDGGIWRG